VKRIRVLLDFACVLLLHGSLSQAASHVPLEPLSGSSMAAASGPGPNAPPSPLQTRYAHFEPTGFEDLPGWQDDDLLDAWAAFQQSCNALQKRPAWRAPCEGMRYVRGQDNVAIRRFFEHQFQPYQILDTNRSTAGMVTGYYEPLLDGSLQRSSPYVYPVHGVPADLLYLDARSLPAVRAAGMRVRVVSPDVAPVSSEAEGGAKVYTVDLSDAQPDIRTRKYRLRIEGDRVVPYFSRQEIEQGRMHAARVIVWVDNPAALYSMHIQGSGRVKLKDGSQLRLGYAEQNGHPFLPSLQTLPQRYATKEKALLEATRGIGNAALAEEIEKAVEQADSADGERTRGIGSRARHADTEAAVNSVVESFLRPNRNGMTNAAPRLSPQDATPGNSPAARTDKPLPARRTASMLTDPQRTDATGQRMAPSAGPTAGPGNDPSYVFFRETSGNANGPIGALGVPLTPGRSVAVDPRTTPLGFPVFISTMQPRTNGALNKLMMAQDTGGAIRGAIRADYFWGFGLQAYLQASKMKEEGRMWVLLPKNLALPATTAISRTRSIGNNDNAALESECLVPDPEFCVD
jgi:membrane-bound lytic murein transglycosylase A